jgi:predicted nucleic acid-binding protein
VLICAWRGEEPYRSAARELLEDEDRHLIASPFLRLELLPKAKNKGSASEVEFLEEVFASITEWVSVDDALVERAIDLGIAYLIRNIDTIHAASAERVGCKQFVTSELPGKPYFKFTAINATNVLQAVTP